MAPDTPVFLDGAASVAAEVKDGQLVCLPPDYSGCAMAVVFELIRQQTRSLSLVGVPQLGLQADLLIGAGCVSSIDAAAVTLGEFGQAPRFVNAVKHSEIRMRDSTCPVIHAGLQAAEKGLPFMPLRGVIGSDLIKHRSDWKIINNPFAAEQSTSEGSAQAVDPILLVPAIVPELALFHAPLADVHGNVWIGTRRELMLMAHAARQSFVTVEKVVEQDLLQDANLAAGVISSLYLSGIACVPGGGAPVGLVGCYPADEAQLAHYAANAVTQAGFNQVLSEYLNA